MVNTWWFDDPEEIFFLETTDRDDVGFDLRAPIQDDANRVHHAYALVPHVRPGDVIFHYQTAPTPRITGWSRAAGIPIEDEFEWAAHGRVAQQAGVKPYMRPHWRVPLEGPFLLDQPVTLQDLRHLEPSIRRGIAAAESAITGTLYRPFQISDKQPLRGTQHYLTKLPLAVIREIPVLHKAAATAAQTSSVEATPRAERGAAAVSADALGQSYVPADEAAATAQRDPFDVDPSVVDRGVQGHATTQNALAAMLAARGINPRSPKSGEPQYDLAWQAHGCTYVAEVKSLTDRNEERQLRLGLGQVLRYQHVLAEADNAVQAVLAVERPPSDNTWRGLCRGLGVSLTWPPFADLP